MTILAHCSLSYIGEATKCLSYVGEATKCLSYVGEVPEQRAERLECVYTKSSFLTPAFLLFVQAFLALFSLLADSPICFIFTWSSCHPSPSHSLTHSSSPTTLHSCAAHTRRGKMGSHPHTVSPVLIKCPRCVLQWICLSLEPSSLRRTTHTSASTHCTVGEWMGEGRGGKKRGIAQKLNTYAH